MSPQGGKEAPTLAYPTRTPVPFAVYQPGNTPDAVTAYGEAEALSGALGALKGGELMDLLLK